MLQLSISLKKNTSYINTGNFLSKSLILKENIAKKKTILLIVEKESDMRSYEKTFSHLHIPYRHIHSVADLLQLEI